MARNTTVSAAEVANTKQPLMCQRMLLSPRFGDFHSTVRHFWGARRAHAAVINGRSRQSGKRGVLIRWCLAILFFSPPFKSLQALFNRCLIKSRRAAIQALFICRALSDGAFKCKTWCPCCCDAHTNTQWGMKNIWCWRKSVVEWCNLRKEGAL